MSGKKQAKPDPEPVPMIQTPRPEADDEDWNIELVKRRL